MFSALRAVPATRALARSFSTSPIAKADVSKLTLIGRLGTDPVERETGAGKKYLTYVVATQPAATKQEDGTYRDGDTSWHTVFNFSEPSHNYVKSAGKGSVVYVEAELEYRKSEPIGEQRVPDRVLLRQQTFRVINRVKPEGSETSE